MSLDQYMQQVRLIAWRDFDTLTDLYSFEAARENGMTPKQAVRDARTWAYAR